MIAAKRNMVDMTQLGPTTGRQRLRRVAMIVALVIIVLFAWSLIEARWLAVSEAVVSSPDVPPEFDGVKIVFAADFHAGRITTRSHLTRTIDLINSAEPDLVILGGDYVGGGRGGHEMFYEEAARLEAPLGILAVLGNHEGRWNPEEIREEFDTIGINVIENRNVVVRNGQGHIRVGGVEDLYTGQPDVEAAAADIGANEFAILLSHQPDVFPRGLERTGTAFDLAVAGHTHGGQITVFGLWAPMLPSRYGQRFRGGWSEIEGVPVLVTRGTGTYMLPMRFFARPQVHVIELRRGDARVEQ